MTDPPPSSAAPVPPVGPSWLAALPPTLRLLVGALIAGMMAGSAVTLFRLTLGALGTWRNAVGLGPDVWWEWLVLPLVGMCGGAIAGWLCTHVAAEASGGGIPDVVRALRPDGHGPRLRFRAVLARFLGGVFGIGGGLSLGREGPSIHIGSGFGELLARHALPQARRTLILAGAAGGMAAAFNTPLAAIAFAIEGLRLDRRTDALAPIMVAAVAGDAMARLAAGNFAAFPFTPAEPPVAALPAYLALGAVCGLLGHLYKRSLVRARAVSLAFADRLPRTWHPAIVGFFTGVVGLGFADAMGGGLNLVMASLYSNLALAVLPLLFVAKLATTAAAFGSGAPGGYLGPTLVLGSIAGLAFGRTLTLVAPGWGLDPGSFAQVGMAALLAAALHLPFTAAVLTVELIGQLGGLLPIMGAVATATVVAARLEPRGLTELLMPDERDA